MEERERNSYKKKRKGRVGNGRKLQRKSREEKEEKGME